MMKKLTLGVGATVMALALAAGPGMAQKSKDTMRMSLDEQIPLVSTYHWPVGQAGQFFRRVYQGLVAFDEHNGKFVPVLAKSWKRTSPTTIEFVLRDDITFHSGNKFTADDFIHTVNYIADPKVKLRFKRRYTWIKQIDKIGPNKIRVTAKKVNATDLALIGFRMLVLDSKIHKTLKKKSDYGRVSASGTGPYKMTMVHRNKGVIAERFENFKGNPKHWRAPIKKIVGIHLPDDQTKLAELMTGGVELVHNISPDNAKKIDKMPNFSITNKFSNYMVFFAIDSANISGNKALADPRVRRALWMSIDRDSLIKHIVPGGSEAEKMKALCFKSANACKWTKDAPPFDPVKAKKLLAEAGYPNGFSMEILAINRIKDIGEAMAGEMRKIGVKVKVQPANIGVYRRQQKMNKLNSWLIAYPAGSFPDAGNHLAVFFGGSRTRYMNKDQIILDAIKKGWGELDGAKRADIYSKAYDRANEMVYNMAVTSLPFVFGHNNDLTVKTSQLSAGDIHVTDFFWK